jgi:hypothetical protein
MDNFQVISDNTSTHRCRVLTVRYDLKLKKQGVVKKNLKYF